MSARQLHRKTKSDTIITMQTKLSYRISHSPKRKRKKKSQENTSSASSSFKDIFLNYSLFEAFLSYCEEKNCEEHLNFYLDVNYMCQLNDPDFIQESAINIYDSYILSGLIYSSTFDQEDLKNRIQENDISPTIFDAILYDSICAVQAYYIPFMNETDTDFFREESVPLFIEDWIVELFQYIKSIKFEEGCIRGAGMTDVSIPDSNKNIRYSGSNNRMILGGSIDKLIEKLSLERLEYTYSFLCSFRELITPPQLLLKLKERYLSTNEEDAFAVRSNVLAVLTLWIILFPNLDFNGKNRIAMEEFLSEIKELGPAQNIYILQYFWSLNKGVDIEPFRDSLSDQELSNDEDRSDIRHILSSFIPDHTVKKYTKTRELAPENLKSMSILDIPPTELAKQLTLIRQYMYQNLKPSEFMNSSWTNPKYDEKCRSILTIISFSNKISNWVATEILSEEKVDVAASIMNYFIGLCNTLVKMNNFDGAMDIYSGLRMHAVHRLVHTWRHVSSKHTKMLIKLEDLLSHSNNWRNYRRKISKMQTPAIPFLGIILNDLTLLSGSEPSKIPMSSLLNFQKYHRQVILVSRYLKYQKDPYPYAVYEPIKRYILLESLSPMTIPELKDLSMTRETHNKNRKRPPRRRTTSTT